MGDENKTVATLETKVSLTDLAIATFKKEEPAVTALVTKYGKLTVKGVDDEQGAAFCDQARKEAKSLRNAIEKLRVQLKKEPWEACKTIDGESNKLQTKLEKLEADLQKQVDIVANEKKRLADLAAKKRLETLKHWLIEFANVGLILTIPDIEDWEDETFAVEYDRAHQKHKAKLAEEEAEQKRQARANQWIAKFAEAGKHIDHDAAKTTTDEDLQSELDAIIKERDRQAAELKRQRDEQKRRQEELDAQQAKIDADRAVLEAAKPPVEVPAVVAASPVAPINPPVTKVTDAHLLNEFAELVEGLEIPDVKRKSEVETVIENAADEIRAIARKR